MKDRLAPPRVMGRGQRSAIGTWTFAGGGLVVEGGRRAGTNACGPLIARLPFPDTWRAVSWPSPRDRQESAAPTRQTHSPRLPKPSEQQVERVSHLVSWPCSLLWRKVISINRPRVERDPGSDRTLVRVSAGRHVRAGTESCPRAATGRVGCGRGRAKLVGPNGVQHRRGRWTGGAARGAREGCARSSRSSLRRAVSLRGCARLEIERVLKPQTRENSLVFGGSCCACLDWNRRFIAIAQRRSFQHKRAVEYDPAARRPDYQGQCDVPEHIRCAFRHELLPRSPHADGARPVGWRAQGDERRAGTRLRAARNARSIRWCWGTCSSSRSTRFRRPSRSIAAQSSPTSPTTRTRSRRFKSARSSCN